MVPFHRAKAHWRFFRRYRVLRRREALLALFLATITVGAETLGLALLMPLIGFIESGRDVAKFAGSSGFASAVVAVFQFISVPVSFLSLAGVSLAFILVRQILNFHNSLVSERMKWSIGQRLSIRLFDAVLSSTASHIRKFKPGEFTLTADYECQAAASVARIYLGLWTTAVTFIAYGSVLFVIAPIASLVAVALIAIVMGCLSFLMRQTHHLANTGIDIRRLYADFLIERFRAWKLIKLSSTILVETEEARKVAQRIVDNRLRMARVSALLLLAFAPILTALLLSIVYVFVEVLALDIATIALFALVLMRMIPIGQSNQAQIIQLNNFGASLDLIDRSLRSAEVMREPLDRGTDLQRVSREIRFEDVSYSYPENDRSALIDICVAIPACCMTAVIGPSGAGKSTLVDLIPRIIDPTRGRVLIDGVPSTDYSLRALRRLIAYVPQEPFLFAATIADNIRYLRPDASDEDVREAAHLANAAEFIERTPNGYLTELGDSGSRLSGGQKQRIVLARAFLANASVLILDEPTSALDYESEAAIQRSIESMVRRRSLTTIVIAHRLSTVRNADFVIHLKDGRVYRKGTAAEVLSQGSEPDPELGLELDAQSTSLPQPSTVVATLGRS